MFCFVSSGNLSRNAYNRMLQLLGHRLPSHTYHMLLQEISKLAHVEQEIYDCCINSCCAYTGDLGPLEQCPHCKEVRFDKWKRPRQQFRYTPLTPRLQSLFLNQKLADTMDYRANYDLSSSNISDVFDSQHYRSLLSQQVVVNNVPQGHRFFSERRDIALGYMTDGFQIFKRQRKGGATCWPIIMINFNLPPDVRVHLPNIIPLGIIPGPKAPIDFNSFEYPFVSECQKLAVGVPTLDARGDSVFDLHAYPLSVMGDMPAMKHCMCFKGHNAIVPCRSCEIQGVRDTSRPNGHYYIPLRPPQNDAPGWDPSQLPLRTEERVEAQLSAIESVGTVTARKQLQRAFDSHKGAFALHNLLVPIRVDALVVRKSWQQPSRFMAGEVQESRRRT